MRCYQIDSTEPADYYRAKVDDIQREFNALETRAIEIYNDGEPGPVAVRAIIARLVASGAQMMLELDEAADIRIGRKLQDSAAGMELREAFWWIIHQNSYVEDRRTAAWFMLHKLHRHATSLWSRGGLRLALFFLAWATGPEPAGEDEPDE